MSGEEKRQWKRVYTYAACLGAMAVLPGIAGRKAGQRFEVIHRLNEKLGGDFLLGEACKHFHVSKPGYYAWRKAHGGATGSRWKGTA